MNSKDIIDAFTYVANEKGIDKASLTAIIEDIFLTLISKKFGEENEDKFSVIVNMDRGEIEIFQEKLVVEKIQDKVHSVASKFLNSNEMHFFGNKPSTRQLIRAWTAKEAVYKALRKPGINFSDNIILDKFNDKAKYANAKFISSDQETTFKLYFYDLDDYCLTIAQEI